MMAAARSAGGPSEPAILAASFPSLEATFSGAKQLSAATAGLALALALTLGILADLLIYRSQPGLNVPIWMSALVACLIVLRRRTGQAISLPQLVCLASSVLLTCLVAWRDSDTLVAFDLSLAAALLLLAVVIPGNTAVRGLSPVRLFAIGFIGLFELLAGTVGLLSQKCWEGERWRAESQDIERATRTLLLTLAVLTLFGGLFVAADAVIEAEVAGIVDIDLAAAGTHILVVATVGWLVAGAFWGWAAVVPEVNASIELSESWKMRTAENALVLGALTLLFALFVAVQVRYLFGGRDVVEGSINLTYAEYARRGFFELVTAALLLLPVLLALDWARTRTRWASVVFRGLSGVLVLLVFAVMASAVQRLRIYEQTFGLTETRLYATAGMFCLGGVLLWFVWTIARVGRDRFVAGALLITVLSVLTLNVLNPDGFIAKNNTDRLGSGKLFDADYALSLSADAVPALVARLDRLDPGDACVVARGLIARWGQTDDTWLNWNLGRERAAEAVRDSRGELDAACARESVSPPRR